VCGGARRNGVKPLEGRAQGVHVVADHALVDQSGRSVELAGQAVEQCRGTRTHGSPSMSSAGRT